MNNELLAVLDYMERERGIDRETLIKAVESALQTAAKKNVSAGHDLRVSIDRKTCDIKAFAPLTVVDKVTDSSIQVGVIQARKYKPDANVGDLVEIEVTPRDFGRIAAQTAKQAILHRIRQAEKDKVYEEYKNRAGDIVSGIVRRFDRSDVVVDLGRAEAILPSKERVPTEEYQVGDRLRALLLSVNSLPQGTELLLSRSNPEFVHRLFELEVSEIADKTVVIKAIAREPGFRSKVAVHSNDDKVDPVGACVGMRGIRVKNIVRELSGEKIDIVRWSSDIKALLTESLKPATITKLELDEVARAASITVPSDQLSVAIGKKGQNARLTSKITGWKIDIHKDALDVTFEEKVTMAVSGLADIAGIGRDRAEKLVHAGFLTIEGILAAEVSDLREIEGFDEATALEVRAAAEKASTAAPAPAAEPTQPPTEAT